MCPTAVEILYPIVDRIRKVHLRQLIKQLAVSDHVKRLGEIQGDDTDVLIGAEERQDSMYQRDECRSRRTGWTKGILILKVQSSRRVLQAAKPGKCTI